MRRFVGIGLVAALVFAVWLAQPSPGAGCHGGCPGHGGTPAPDTRVIGEGAPGATPALLASVPLIPEAGRSLYLIKITLEPGVKSDSNVAIDESTLFYVQSGAIKFSGPTMTELSYQPDDPAIKAEADGSLTVSPGGVLRHDPGSVLIVNYKNMGTDNAELIIAAAPSADATVATPPS